VLVKVAHASAYPFGDAREKRTCTHISRTREEIRLNRDVHV